MPAKVRPRKNKEEGGPQLKRKSGGASNMSLTMSLYAGLLDTMEEMMGGEMIVELCEKLDVKQKDKDGEEAYGSFCLDYFYNQLIKGQVEDALRVFLEEQLGKKSKANVKEVEAANAFNQRIELEFEDDDLGKYIGYCKSHQQLKFWKMLWYKYFERVNLQFKLKGFKGKLCLPKNFYPNSEVIFAALEDERNPKDVVEGGDNEMGGGAG